jgi:isopentenyl diphosphate isomerase/L-lactate dehydrogenase-like FMN-dependent dehydrogenase
MLYTFVDHGHDAVSLTVDTPVAGNRERDIATGMALPPRLTLRSLLGFVFHPRWVLPMLFGKSFDLANVIGHAPSVSKKRAGVTCSVSRSMASVASKG